MNGETLVRRVRQLTGDDRLNPYDELNDAYKTLLTRGGLWISRVVDETTLEFRADVKTYTLPMHKIRRFESLAAKAVVDEKEWSLLEEITDIEFDRLVFANLNEAGDAETDLPTAFKLLGGGEFEVSPVPNASFPVRITYTGNPPDITRLTEPILPEPYHVEIARMASVALLMQTPTSNPEYELRMDKASRLERQAEKSYFPMANDTANNRTGVNFAKQRIMRS